MRGSRADVAIVGGGVIGCALARELAGRGASVTIIERGEPGCEASGAAAGLLAPQAENLEPGPLLDLALESRRLYPRWVADLVEETGIDVGYRASGILRCALPEEESPFEAFDWQRRAGLPIETCGPAQVASRSGGAAAGDIAEALLFPEEGFVNNRLLMRALRLSGERRGVVFRSETRALRMRIAAGRCAGVETDRGGVEADRVVDAAGAWAGFDPGFPVSVEPVRGQIVEIESPIPLPVVLESRDVYVVPRGGSLLLGSTAERVGFDKRVTAGAIECLLAAAKRLLPGIARSAFRGAWAGLRPGTPDGLPILGASGLPGLFLAAGHFRNGILLAPVTSIVMADVVSGGATRDLGAFSAARFRQDRAVRLLAGRA